MAGTVVSLSSRSIWLGFLALVVLAIALASIGIDWNNPISGVVLNAVCFIPLALVAYRSALAADQLNQELAAHDEGWLARHRQDHNLLRSRAAEMGAARVHALQSHDVAIDHVGRGTPQQVVGNLRSRFIAGDDIGMGSSLEYARELNLQRLEPLSGQEQTALALGFLGTLIGIIYQVMLAQRAGATGQLDTGFLGGTLFAVTTTLQGVFSAFYVRWLRSALLARMDAQLEETLRLVSTVLVPALGDSESRVAAEVARILNDAAQRLENRFGELAVTLAAKISEAMKGVPTAVATAVQQVIKEHLAKEISDAVGNLTTSLSTTVTGLKSAVEHTEKVIAAGAEQLRLASTRIETQLKIAVETPGELTRSLRESQTEIANVADAYALIAKELNDAAKALEGVDNRVLESADRTMKAAELASARAHAGQEHLGHATKSFEDAVQHLGRVVETLVKLHLEGAKGSRDRGGDVPRGWNPFNRTGTTS